MNVTYGHELIHIIFEIHVLITYKSRNNSSRESRQLMLDSGKLREVDFALLIGFLCLSLFLGISFLCSSRSSKF
jgi:hypothetical protein